MANCPHGSIDFRGAMLAFEIAFGRLVFRASWRRIASNFEFGFVRMSVTFFSRTGVVSRQIPWEDWGPAIVYSSELSPNGFPRMILSVMHAKLRASMRLPCKWDTFPAPCFGLVRTIVACAAVLVRPG